MAAWRIYLSSTFLDLEGFREKVLERLRRAQSVVVAMEDYAAFDERPADKCLADVAGCDIYIGVLGRRYGYVPPDDNPGQLSITEMEYRRAGNPGPGRPPLKRLLFQLDPGADWPEKFCDAKTGENEAGARIDRFRTEVSARHGIRSFREPEELAGLVLESLLAMMQPESAWRWPPIWDFGAYMAHKGKDFVGRDWLFRDIDTWLAQAAPRALLIRADFGVGKSAILSELIKRNPGGAIAGWHFCQHDTQDTLAPATFVRSLAAQLAAALPAYRALVEAEPALRDRLDKAGDDPASAFEAAIVGPLGRIAAPGGPRLLIVDALDEALEVDPATAQRHGNLIRLLAGKAGRLPEWLRLLVTSRNNPEVIRPLGTFGLKEIDAENVANQSDLRDYALLRCVREPLAGRLHEAGRSPADIADILRAKSRGKFLYTIHALDGLENGSIGPDDLAALPPGMDSFYHDAFERRFARAGRDYTQARELLGVLALAKEPLPAATLTEILDQPASALQAVRKVLPDFIRLRGDLWAFDHYSLAEWLTGVDDDGFPRAGEYTIDAEASQERFHAWAMREFEGDTTHDSPYLVRHLAAHLPDDDERRRVFAKLMLTRYEWIAARLRLRGIEALIGDCKHLGDLAEAPLLRALFRSSAHVLRQYPDQLPAQLIGRIGPEDRSSVGLTELLASTRLWLSQEKETVHQRLPQLLPKSKSLRLSRSLIRRLDGHEGGVYALAVMPNGFVASASEDATLRIWDVDGPRDPLILEGHTGPIETIIVLSDGRIASCSHDGSLRIWTIGPESSGRLAKSDISSLVLEGHTQWLRCLAPLPDGSIASGSDDGTIRVWDPNGTRHPIVLSGHTDSIQVLVPMSDGRLASSSYDGTLRIWSPKTGDCLVHQCRTRGILALAVLQDGRIASASGNGFVQIWEVDRPDEPRVCVQHNSSAHALLVLHDGRLASASDDGTIRICGIGDQQEPIILEGHAEWVQVMAELPDGRIATASNDGFIQIADPSGKVKPIRLAGHSDWVRTLTVLPDGRLASGSDDHTIRIWNSEIVEELDDDNRHMGCVISLLPISGDRVASCSYDTTVRIWNDHGQCLGDSYQGHTDTVWAIAELSDGRLASASEDRTIRVWETGRFYESMVLEGHTGSVTALTRLPDGRLASASGDGRLFVWSLRDARDRLRLDERAQFIETMCLVDDGWIAIGNDQGEIRIRDVHRSRKGRTLKGHKGSVRSLATLAGGVLASAGDDCTIRIWAATGSDKAETLNGHTGPVFAMAPLPDGRLASAASDCTIRIWNCAAEFSSLVLHGHTGAIWALAPFNKSLLASASSDNTVRVWNTVSGDQVAMFVSDSPVRCLAAVGGGSLAAGDADGAVHFLQLIS